MAREFVPSILLARMVLAIYVLADDSQHGRFMFMMISAAKLNA